MTPASPTQLAGLADRAVPLAQEIVEALSASLGDCIFATELAFCQGARRCDLWTISANSSAGFKARAYEIKISRADFKRDIAYSKRRRRTCLAGAAMSRDRIDWDNLAPLPRKKRDGATPDDLAERRFNMQKAHHKGRCHLSNQKRRQIAKERAAVAAKSNQIKVGKFRALKDRIRAYWAGEEDVHP